MLIDSFKCPRCLFLTVFLTSAILGHLTGIGRNRMVKNSVFGIRLIFSGLLLVLSNGVMAGSWEVLQEYDREHDYFAFFFVSATDGWVVGGHKTKSG